MTDTFLDDHTTKTFARDCKIIARHNSELLRIARREVSPPGGKTHRPPKGYGSRPPLSIGALSASHELHTCLTGWMRYLRDDAHIPYPDMIDDTGIALHLALHAHRVAQQVWAQDCADEIQGWANTVIAITTPPPDKKLDDYTPAQKAEGMATAKVDATLCAQLVAEWTRGEHQPSPDKIREWGRRGHVDMYGPKSRRVYSVASVIDHARHAKAQAGRA